MDADILLTVVMPVYNGAGFLLRESIESILDQDFQKFEFIIIDDGSTDESHAIISHYAACDQRIRVITNKNNCGIVAALNRGILAARSKLIARMDCGDFSFPDRLTTQYEFMTTHPEHVLVSSQVVWTDDADRILRTTTFPTDDVSIRQKLFTKDNVLMHPAVMFRLLPNMLYHERSCAEDYDLWLRLSLSGKLHIIDRPLLKVRLNAQGTTYSRKIMQIRTVDAIHVEFRERFLKKHGEYVYDVPVLGSLENAQQDMFSYFTGRAMGFRRSSKVLYALCKLLSVLVCPVYLWFLLASCLRKLTVRRDALFRKYVTYGH